VPESAKDAQRRVAETPVLEPLTTSREAILRLGRDVAEGKRKRMTVPELPSAIAKAAAPPRAPRQ
jgi:hypothetical protein